MSKTSTEGTETSTVLYPSAGYEVEGSEKTIYVNGPQGASATIHFDGLSYAVSSNHQDHLGSTAVVTDSSGTLKELLDYNPYGTERLHTGSSSTSALPSDEAQKTYIGEYSDDDSGLSYLNARYYDAARGQFLSEDPAQMDERLSEKLIYDPQSLNYYAYSRNNPLTYTDPNGEEFNRETGWDALVMWIDAGIKGTSAIQKGFAAGMTAPSGIVGSALSADLAVGAMADYDDGLVASTNAMGNTINAFQGEETQTFMTEGPLDQILPEEAQTTVDILQTTSDFAQIGVNVNNSSEVVNTLSQGNSGALETISQTMYQIGVLTADTFDAIVDLFTGENSSQILKDE